MESGRVGIETFLYIPSPTYQQAKPKQQFVLDEKLENYMKQKWKING
jgi:hypothetical protein